MKGRPLPGDRRGGPPHRGHGASGRPGGRGPEPGHDFKPRKRSSRPPLAVIHEDADLIVVDKPPGLVTANRPGEAGQRESLFDHVKDHLRAGKRRPVRVWIIHRLDKEASGLLVFAKTEKAFNWLKEDLRARRMHRLYLAAVEGEIGENAGKPADGTAAGVDSPGERSPARKPQAPAGTIQSFIHEDDIGGVKSIGLGDVARQAARGRDVARQHARDGREEATRFKGPRPEGDNAPRLAVTHWRLIAAGQGRSLLQLRLETGRKNQIRVHMQQFGHPIIGDSRYGARSDPIRRMALHAAELGFTHPGTGRSVRFYSPAPAAFYQAVGAEPPEE